MKNRYECLLTLDVEGKEEGVQDMIDRLKGEFIQNVSHELRQPLALIRGHAELLSAGELGELIPLQQKSAEIVSRRAQMLSELVEDITLILEAETSPAMGVACCYAKPIGG